MEGRLLRVHCCVFEKRFKGELTDFMLSVFHGLMSQTERDGQSRSLIFMKLGAFLKGRVYLILLDSSAAFLRIAVHLIAVSVFYCLSCLLFGNVLQTRTDHVNHACVIRIKVFFNRRYLFILFVHSIRNFTSCQTCPFYEYWYTNVIVRMQ